MDNYLYVSLVPESLIVSMLPPSEFGHYLAVGTEKRSREQAMYFELKDGFESEHFDLSGAIQLCTPHEDGRPKHSVYVSTYRVLEHVPLEALGSLWLITKNGLALELKQGSLQTEVDEAHHLYQEISPVHPLIASSLSPAKFCEFITDPNIRVSVPKICFVELRLGPIPQDLQDADAGDLPYENIKHLWSCMLELTERNKITKTVDRTYRPLAKYRCIKTGFYIGDHNTVLYYPFPSAKELERDNHRWWRWAQES